MNLCSVDNRETNNAITLSTKLLDDIAYWAQFIASESSAAYTPGSVAAMLGAYSQVGSLSDAGSHHPVLSFSIPAYPKLTVWQFNVPSRTANVSEIIASSGAIGLSQEGALRTVFGTGEADHFDLDAEPVVPDVAFVSRDKMVSFMRTQTVEAPDDVEIAFDPDDYPLR